jgi:phage terminase small subunit
MSNIASKKEILAFLTKVIRNEITEDVVILEKGVQGQTMANTIYKDVSVKDRSRAVEILNRGQGMLTDWVELAAPTIIDEIQ